MKKAYLFWVDAFAVALSANFLESQKLPRLKHSLFEEKLEILLKETNENSLKPPDHKT